MQKIIIVGQEMNLGHEIHTKRLILLDMLNQNIVSKDDVIVVTNKDRMFLYNAIFKNCITLQDYESLDKRGFDIIDLTPLMNFDLYQGILDLRQELLNKFGYDLFINKKDDGFYSLCRNVNYFPPEIQERTFPFIKKEPFIIVHFRYSKRWAEQNTSFDPSQVQQILLTIKDINPSAKIIVFNSLGNSLAKHLKPFLLDNLYFTDDLRLYTSLMNNKNCKLVIGELSGGTELSYYCSNAPILIWSDYYNNVAEPGHLLRCFDHDLSIEEDKTRRIINNGIKEEKYLPHCRNCCTTNKKRAFLSASKLCEHLYQNKELLMGNHNLTKKPLGVSCIYPNYFSDPRYLIPVDYRWPQNFW